MNTWFRKVGMGALALTLAGVLGGCNDGSGGGGLIRLFFGINGQGNCSQVIVDVNLDTSGAVIARDDLGDVQCVINSLLDDAGCDITFTEFSNGGLRAIISGCTIPAVSSLFSCLFEDVDISNLEETSSGQCSCTSESCDPNPPVCISLDEHPDSCEVCNNGEDDDDNGLTDCEDPNCKDSQFCQLTTTTSTTSTTVTNETTTTTNTTSTTVSTTTSTTISDQFNCTMIFRLTDDVVLGSLQFDTDYSNAPGEFVGQGGQVECSKLISNAIAAFNDCDTPDCVEFDQKPEVLDSGIIALDGFTGPVNVSECTFRANVTPVASDFTVTVTEASAPDLTPVLPAPGVEIFSIDCDSVTTTTGEPPTTTTTEGGPTTTTTTLPGGEANFSVTFHLDSAAANVGALQWSTDYSAATGGFQGKGATVTCVNKVAQSLFAPNDKDLVCSLDETKVCTVDGDCSALGKGTCTVEKEVLTLGIISLDSFAAPLDLVTCTFNGSAGDPPVPADFVVTIEDSTDAGGDPIDSAISVVVAPAP